MDGPGSDRRTDKTALTGSGQGSVDTYCRTILRRTNRAVSSGGFRKRTARPEDLDQLVDVDLLSFRSVYRHQGIPLGDLRADLRAKFHRRMELIGWYWTEVVVSSSGVIVGFLTACPTSKDPSSFESWEETTDHGTLANCFDPSGRFLYVVTLSVTPGAVAAGVVNMLYLDVFSKAYSGQIKQAYFESRLPGLRRWIAAQQSPPRRSLDALSSSEIVNYAERYIQTTMVIGNREVPIDPFLRSYAHVGARFIRVVPDAYQDVPSMNMGVLVAIDNRLPTWARELRIPGAIAGGVMRTLGRSHRIALRLQ